MTIYDYFKLTAGEKETLLKTQALLIEQFRDNSSEVFVYFLNNFFVEVTMNNGRVIDNLPYTRGYNMKGKNLHHIEKRNAA